MPIKDPERKRAYHREYMRQRRAAVNPEPPPVLNPHQEPRQFDPERPYTVENRFPYPAYMVQDSYWYHWETGELVGRVR